MRIDVEGKFAEMCSNRGRADLVGQEVEIDDTDFFDYLNDVEKTYGENMPKSDQIALAAYTAVFHVNSKHPAKALPQAPEPPTTQAASAQVSAQVPQPAPTSEPPEHPLLLWLWRAAVIILLLILCSNTSRGQTPHDPILLRGINTAGTTLFTRQAGLLELKCGTNLTCTFGSNRMTMDAGAGASTAWEAITNPAGNLSLSMGAFLSTFTTGTGTGATNLWTWQDTTGNTGTGYLATFASVGTSSLKPLRICAGGTTNCVSFDHNALFSASGSAVNKATQVQLVTFTGPTVLRTLTVADADATLVGTTRAVNATSPITGGGDLSADRTIACATCTTSAAALTSGNLLVGAGSQAMSAGVSTSSTVGQTLRVTGAGTYAFGALDLADGDAVTGTLPDANIPDTVTASNYLPLAGGTLTGQLVTDNLGVEFDESDTNPACAAGNYNIFADLSETKLKKCTNGVATDLDTDTTAAHNMLSATHSDSTAASATRGDIITAQDVSPTWKRLAKGTQYQVLNGGADEPAWGAVSLDQATAVSGILGAANGGTGNGFTAFSGPATSTKTFTLPNASTTILTTNAAVTVAQGGTGATTLTGVLQGNGTSAVTAITDSSTGGQVLRVTGASTYAWGALDLADGDAVTGTLPVANIATAVRVRTIGLTIDGGGSAITTGVKGFASVPYACTINSATLLADQSGSIVIDVWKDAYANFPPTVADTITAAAKPTLSAAQKSQDSTLTGWTTAVADGDVIGFNVDSASTVTRVSLFLKCTI